jgi:IS4 transposase
LTGSKTKKLYPKPVRKVRSYDKEYHHTYEFITNNLEMRAQEIADIYKRRRQMELFFNMDKTEFEDKVVLGN